jgi:cell division protein FtsB
MRWLTLIFVALIAALQYPLWLGKGSWLRVWEVDHAATQQKEINQKLRARNASLDAEVRDLKQGYDAIEERARSELGMIKRDEVFFQVLEEPKSTQRVQPDVKKKDAPQMEAAKR